MRHAGRFNDCTAVDLVGHPLRHFGRRHFFGFLIGALVLRLRSFTLHSSHRLRREIIRAVISAEDRRHPGAERVGDDAALRGVCIPAPPSARPTRFAYYVMLGHLPHRDGHLGLDGGMPLAHSFHSAEDEEAAAALGVHVVRYKVLVFTVTAMMAAAAGAVQGHYVGIITPNILIILQMSLVIAMAVIGGLENIYAAAIGAILLLFSLELLRNSFDIGPVTVDMTTWRLVFFGLLLMVTLRFFRNGLIYPIIMKISRWGMDKETVSKRNAATSSESAG
ncbi:MAG: hypothetical protein R2838_06950 [Caldilineaceae bacterium]